MITVELSNNAELCRTHLLLLRRHEYCNLSLGEYWR